MTIMRYAFEIPSTSDRGELDTPLIKLIRQLPDMAEEVLDRCCEEPPDKKDVSVIKMYSTLTLSGPHTNTKS